MSPTLTRAPSERPQRQSAREARPNRERIDWDALEPRGAYARVGRPLLQGLLVVMTLVPIAVLGVLVGALNLAYFRDPRAVFYVQPRVGRRGRVFRLYKFRTMRDAPDGAHASWASGGDVARVTWLGRFLRNSHLDELPQILNILRGEMCFIGPRPEMVEIEQWAAEHVEGFSNRLVLTPGITGYAQITQGYTGRQVEAYAEKLALNELYRRELSLKTDLAILARTAVWMVRGKGWRWQAPHAERKV